ncbi:MAG TPA: hypothetical protein PKJ53_02305 [Spirochaetales bacterium]|nr:hypothetical protein [Spirochaetales bacterium]
MKTNKASPENSLSWAGSDSSNGRTLFPAQTEASGQQASKLYEIKSKLDDTTYVDGAVSKIASFLTDTLKKKDKNGR